MERANEVLEFWFGRGPWDAARLEERSRFWFGGGDDALVRSTLEPMLERASRGEFAAWAASPKRRLALIILFDQVPRSAYRGTAAAFAFDREALALSLEGLQLAADAALDPPERLFFYLPLEHAESMEAQDTAVAALARLAAEAPAEFEGACEGWLGFARRHQEIIAKFGRFPYRNKVLNRESTAAELEWLAAQPDHFGQ
jgi:uncharacterized protein (DUF924 family)